MNQDQKETPGVGLGINGELNRLPWSTESTGTAQQPSTTFRKAHPVLSITAEVSRPQQTQNRSHAGSLTISADAKPVTHHSSCWVRSPRWPSGYSRRWSSYMRGGLFGEATNETRFD
jgi:hypothetical protein